MSERDRDPGGRARNARPRDEFGRPLAHDAPGIERIPEDLVLGPAETLTEAQRLIDGGRPFNAHEVLEARWKSCDPAERDLWQGLAQLAVGLTHIQRGNRSGAVALLTRGGERIAGYAENPPYAVDVTGLLAYVSRTVASLETGATDAQPPRLTT